MFNAPKAVTRILAVTVLAHAVRVVSPLDFQQFMFERLALIPARYTISGGLTDDIWATVLSPLGYTLLHANLMHIFVNMSMFLAFGSAVARRMGEKQFYLLYGLSAIAGAVATTMLTPHSYVPVIGASAAVSGIIGALGRISLSRNPALPPPYPFHRRSLAITFVASWVGLNLLFAFIPGSAFGVDGRIAWEAHLGGFIIGALLAPYVDGRGKRRYVWWH